MKILNFGSLNIDKVYDVKAMVKEGETIQSRHYDEFIGGKGLNQSIALAKAGCKTYHAGKVGKDGLILINSLQENNVDINLVEICDGPSGHAIIQVDESGRNSIIVEGGSNRKIDTNQVDSTLSKFSEGDWILLQNEISNLTYIIDTAKKMKLNIALNASPITDDLLKLDLNYINLLFINEFEGFQLTGENKPDKIADKLIGKYPLLNLVLTLGKEGSIFCKEGKIIHQEAYKFNAVDTTGAGDTFTGYFLANYVKNEKIEDCLKFASLASGISVTVKGASNSIPKFDEVKKYYEEHIKSN